jgi:nitroreductase
MDAIECMKTRRSIRNFKNQKVSDEIIDNIIENGCWAPSGLNHQPWKVIIVTEEKKKKELANCTHYNEIINNAPHTLAIYLDQSKKYNYVKNVQSIGAFFQNILLALHALGLGGVWLGEIYNQKEQVDKVLDINNPNLEFMGAIAFGYPDETSTGNRLSTQDVILKRI